MNWEEKLSSFIVADDKLESQTVGYLSQEIQRFVEEITALLIHPSRYVQVTNQNRIFTFFRTRKNTFCRKMLAMLVIAIMKQ